MNSVRRVGRRVDPPGRVDIVNGGVPPQNYFPDGGPLAMSLNLVVEAAMLPMRPMM